GTAARREYGSDRAVGSRAFLNQPKEWRMSNNPSNPGPERKSLGRGLSSLLPAAGSVGSIGATAAGPSVATPGAAAVVRRLLGPLAFTPRHLPIEKIRPRLEQPRKSFDPQGLEELSRSIREKGILQPLLVQKSETGHDYLLIAGERRLRAATLAGLK